MPEESGKAIVAGRSIQGSPVGTGLLGYSWRAQDLFHLYVFLDIGFEDSVYFLNTITNQFSHPSGASSGLSLLVIFR